MALPIPTVSLPGEDPPPPATSTGTTSTDPPDQGTTTTTTSQTTTSTTSTTTTSQTSTSQTTSTSTTSTSVTSTSGTSTSSGGTSSGSGTSTSTEPTKTPAPTPTPTQSPYSTTHLQTVTSGGQVLTLTSVIEVTPTGAVETSHSTAGTPFLKNKAAVAGTFTAVGLVALVVLAVLATSYLRRRRARKFDDEVEEAAAEAAKAGGHPDDFDDYNYPAAGVSGLAAGAPSDYTSSYAGFSDTTHGTYAQAPMGHAPQETYGMREMAPYDPYPLGTTAAGVAVGAAGAAGVGAGASAIQRQRSMRDAPTPYHAFAGPGAIPGASPPLPPPLHTQDAYDPYSSGPAGPDSRQLDLLDAAGLSPISDHTETSPISAGGSPTRRSAAAAAVERGLSIAQAPGMPVPAPSVQPGLQRNRSITLTAAEQGFYAAPASGSMSMPEPMPAPALMPHPLPALPSSSLMRSKSAHLPSSNGVSPPESYASHYQFDAPGSGSRSGSDASAGSGAAGLARQKSAPLASTRAPAPPESYASRYAPTSGPGARPVSAHDAFAGYYANGPQPSQPPPPEQSHGSHGAQPSQDISPTSSGSEYGRDSLEHDGERDYDEMSMRDEEDYGHSGARRVLRVANE